MPYCPNCKIEYRANVKKCADCGEPLVEADPDYEEGEGDFVVLGEWAEAFELKEVCELLEDAGIECTTQGADANRMVGIHSGASGKVLVKKESLTEAKEIVNAYMSGEFLDDEIEFLECSECGAAVDPEDQFCPACGTELAKEEE